MSQLKPNPPRRLDAVVGARGRVITWRCTACNWTKLPDDPQGGVTDNTRRSFASHNCEEHLGGEKDESILKLTPFCDF